MAMTTTINSNTISMAEYKGPISRCPMCRPEETLLGRACKWCMGNGFIAKCLNCDGTGKFKGRTAWDGGKNPHESTCGPCAGNGVFPARKPADWVDQEPATKSVVETPTVTVS